MKTFKKILGIALAALMIMQLGAAGITAGAAGDYTIVSPYEEVIWSGDNAWGAYKGSLHSHSTYSDADDTLEVMVKESYRRGYDFLCVSDHGITGVEWDEDPFFHPLYIYQFLIDNPFEHLTTEDYEAIKNGTFENRGYGMTPVLGGNEFNNLSLTKNHVNGHFLKSNEGNGFPGAENEAGYDQALKYIDDHDGLSYINHPGDWLDSNSNPDIVNDEYSVKFFGDLILKYDSCLGTEVFNERNGTTGYDRILWDNLLMYTLPYGKTVIGFSNSDAHHPGTIDSSFSVFMMKENNVENIEATMQSGAFFGITRKIRPNDTLGPEEEIDVIDSGIPYPMFSSLTVDGHKINAGVTDANYVQFIANGKVIAKMPVSGNGSVTLDLDKIPGAEDFQYVRAEIYGEGGICISQALVIDNGTAPLEFKAEEPSIIDRIVTWFKGTKIYAIVIEISRL